jgi:hypothetical protein
MTLTATDKLRLANEIFALNPTTYTSDQRLAAKRIIDEALGVPNVPIKWTPEELAAMRFAIGFLRDYGKYPTRRGGYNDDYRISNESYLRKQRIEAADTMAACIGDRTIAQLVAGDVALDSEAKRS